ncbi:MAG: cell division protein FtsA [Candidatus Dojkabacteria bacterium]
MANIITAIDIGSTKVCTIIALVDEEGKAKVIGEASYPAHGIKKGEITGIDEAINSIASSLSGAERMAGLTVSSAYVTINGKQILSNNNKGVVAISDTEITEDDVFRALEQAKTVAIPQSREIIHLIPREFIVDQQTGIKVPLGMTGTRLEVDSHIISVPVTAKHNLEKCIQSIGLKLDGIVFTGWAASHSVLTPTEKELGVLLLDIGGGTVSITTFVEDEVTYSTSISFGGSNITRDLAAGLRLSLDEAEKVKINAGALFKGVEGIGTKSKSRDEEDEDDSEEKKKDIIDVSSLGIEGIKTISRKLFNVIVEERVSEIFELVIQNIDQAGYEFKLPAGIVITGGSSQIPGLANMAKKAFGVPARVGNPKGLEGLVEGLATPAFSAAQGLILYALNDEVARGDSSRYSTGGSVNKKRTSSPTGGLLGRITGIFKTLAP